MLFKKSHSVKMPIKALNTPENWEEFVLPKQIKTASITSDASDEDLGGFDLKQATKEHPDNLYVKIFAIKKDEVNDNGDAFNSKELKKAAPSFIGVPLFTNHQNDDVEKARGECVHAWYDAKAGGIYIIGRVDKVAYPKLARSIEEGYVKGTSMGCSVEFSCCSVCHNYAKTADEYCEHVRERKNRKFSGDIKCKYFDNEDAEGDKCPLCSCTKNKTEKLNHKDQPIYEHNFGLKFIENSFVVNPACHECGITCILNEPELEKKVASAISAVNNILKHSNHTDHQENIAKFGGVKELQSLKQSMEELKSVMRSMMKQSDNVSMEYVTEISKAVSDIEATFDELNEMGYGRLPSPEGIETADAGGPDINAFPDVASDVASEPAPPVSSGGEASSSDLGGLGSITKPKFSSKTVRKIKDFLTENEKITNKLSSTRDNLSKLQIHRRIKMADTITQVSSDTDNRQVIISKEDDGVFVTEAAGDDILKLSNVNQFPEEMQELIKSDPEKAASEILQNSIEKETGDDMSNKTTKVAADMSNHEVITEKQLEKKTEPLHSRKDEVYEGITESKEQIGRTEDLDNVTTSESPQNRKGSYETITEDQFDTESSGYVVRWDDMLDVITEKQWTDMSRLVSANIPDDYTESITDAQLRDLLASHTYCGPVEVITEKQFADRVNHQDLNRWASADYAKDLVKTATSVIADTVSKFDKSVDDVNKVVSYVNSDPDKKRKVIALSLINNLPWKKADRVKVAQNSSFNKLASKANDVTALDAFIIAIADNAKFPQKAEDVLDSIVHALSSKKAMAQVDEKIKAATSDSKEIKKADALESAITELDRPEDGKYQIHATLEDIGADPKDKVAFHAALNKFAQETIDDAGVAAAIIKVQVGEDGSSLIIDIEDGADESVGPDDIGDFIEGPVEDIVDEVAPEGGEEQDMRAMETGGETSPMESAPALAGAREEIKKQAQMMGGELGGQGGMSQAPGAGASLPQPPADPASQAPLESFSDEGDLGMDDEFDEDLEPAPPGTHCVVCTSRDVDIVGGKGKCNNCGSEMTFKVAVEVTNYAGITPDSSEGGEDVEGGVGEGEGFKMPEGEALGGDMAPMDTAPAMASAGKINPGALQKLASIQEKAKEASENKEEIQKLSEETGVSLGNLRKMTSEVIKPGSVSPSTGSADTLDLGKGEYMCLATGIKHKVSFVTDKKGDSLWAQWEWTPKMASDCPSCSRAKQRFIKALSSIDITEASFDEMGLKDKVDTIKKIKETSKLASLEKVADKEGNVIDDYKLAYGNYGESFPMEDCVEKIARRFGNNALALSGPCEGKKLADCLCTSLKSAGIYSDNVAYKIASSWSDCDGDEECITHQVREGHTLREATAICETLKVAVASPIDLLASELKVAQEFEESMDEGAPEDIVDEDPFESGDVEGGFDEGGGEVTLSLSTETAEELKTELETSGVGEVGGDVEGELGGGEDIPVDGAPVEEVVGPDDLSPMSDGGEMSPMDAGGCEGVTPEEGVVFDDEKNGGKVTVNDNTSGNTDDMAYMASSDNKEYTIKEASYMSSKVGKTGQMGLDLSGVVDAINKTAGEKQVQHKNVQDVSEIGTYTAGEDGSKMGHESETIPSAAAPDVPRDKSLMGQEDSDLNPQDKPQPSIPSSNATMGHEDEAGLSGGDHSYTGGDDGAGTSQASIDDDIYHMKGFGNSNDSLERLAKRILEAGDKKVNAPKPVADDKDIQPVSGESTLGKEPPLTLETPQNVKGSGNESQMGHENESQGDRPDSPKDHPSIPADNATMGQEGEDIAPEKQTNVKGTVIAENDAESEAYRVAGKMLEHGKISASELQSKITELSAYKPAQISDIEKAIFASEKGLDTAPDGKLSQPVIINEASNERSSQDDLSKKLASLFTIERQNRWADSDEGTQMRRTYGKY
tara:strand:+ start:693 stop:6446 length:5754 start_codon:yes stop_codon:yes gene_type:complete